MAVEFCQEIVSKAETLSVASMQNDIWEQEGMPQDRKNRFKLLLHELKTDENMPAEQKQLHLKEICQTASFATSFVLSHIATDVVALLDEDVREASSSGAMTPSMCDSWMTSDCQLPLTVLNDHVGQ